MRIIGITGGIGSGKSSVLNLLKSKYISVINSDLIVDKLLRENPKVIKFCKTNFDIHLDESSKKFSINKLRLAKILFNDLDTLNNFEAFIWPIAFENVKKNIRSDNITLIEASKLFEAGWNKICDFVLTIEANAEICISRTIRRSNLSRSAILLRMKNQSTSKYRRDLSDFILDNNFSFAELEEKVKYFSKNNLINQ
ncbi:MAG: dephospho-CoA kinase [Chloroflexi bacterium]|nr:dephospho-CoA kinase [Chloroflexota bacterium]|tara:strand:+ start:65 stop:655 length:591 start_codon:yes stop_codon:yes gene_type:complete